MSRADVVGEFVFVNGGRRSYRVELEDGTFIGTVHRHTIKSNEWKAVAPSGVDVALYAETREEGARALLRAHKVIVAFRASVLNPKVVDELVASPTPAGR